ncbi:hypothetical protein HHK36_005160 [Tetracentron sinense]|uniref:Uncharacterized protein n=1 Tax=Tetracentron sinense TaxID=13715 RepID=A0A834ZUZ7_TETSI|nr:hypothetical protein HHK36_005160 [Tetracentron sinense]
MNTGETPVLLRTAYSPDSLSLCSVSASLVTHSLLRQGIGFNGEFAEGLKHLHQSPVPRIIDASKKFPAELFDMSSRSYYKWISSLEIIAKVRTFVVMLDLKCDALVLEMLQNFLKSMRMTVLLGRPSSRKTPLLLALAGKIYSGLERYWQRCQEERRQTLNHILMLISS